MKPIVLIHGYSAESKTATPSAITKIYGTMPQALRQRYNDKVVEIDICRGTAYPCRHNVASIDL